MIVTEQKDPYYKSAGIDIALDITCVGQGLGERHAAHGRALPLRGARPSPLTIDPALANERAIGAYEKVGFKRIGVGRQYEKGADGTFHDNLLMDMLADELR